MSHILPSRMISIHFHFYTTHFSILHVDMTRLTITAGQQTASNQLNFMLDHLLPGSGQYQSNFRTLPHDNSKPNSIRHWSVAVTWSTAITQCTCSAPSFLFKWLLLHFNSRTSCKHLLPWPGKPRSHSWRNASHAIIRYSLLEWDVAIAVRLHPFIVSTCTSCQAISPMAWNEARLLSCLVTARPALYVWSEGARRAWYTGTCTAGTHWHDEANQHLNGNRCLHYTYMYTPAVHIKLKVTMKQQPYNSLLFWLYNAIDNTPANPLDLHSYTAEGIRFISVRSVPWQQFPWSIWLVRLYDNMGFERTCISAVTLAS